MVSNLVSTQKMANFVCCNSTKLDPRVSQWGYAGIVYTSRYTHGGLSFACEALFVCFARNYDYGCVADMGQTSRVRLDPDHLSKD